MNINRPQDDCCPKNHRMPGFQAAAGEPSRPHQSTEASLSSCERRQSLHRFQRFPENGVQSTNQKKRIARSKTYHWGLLLHQKTTNRKNKSASLLHGVVMTGKLYRKLNISQPFTSKIYSPWSRYDELIEMAQVVPHRRPCIRSHSPTALRTFQVHHRCAVPKADPWVRHPGPVKPRRRPWDRYLRSLRSMDWRENLQKRRILHGFTDYYKTMREFLHPILGWFLLK